MKTRTKIVISAAIVLLLAVVLLSPRASPVVNIRSGNVGAVTRSGAFVRVEQPGLRFKLPFIENIRMVSVRPQQRTFPVIEAYTADGDAVGVRVAVAFRPRLQQISEGYELYGDDLGRYLDLMVPDRVRAAMREISTAQLLSDRYVAAERLQADIAKASSKLLIFDLVLIERFQFSRGMQAVVDLYQARRLLDLERALVEQSEQVQLALDEARLRRELAIKKQRDAANLASAIERAKIIADNPGAKDILVIDNGAPHRPLEPFTPARPASAADPEPGLSQQGTIEPSVR